MLLTSYERDAIRPHVLGRFHDMLLATARHPAMLFYLDNYQSQAPRDTNGLVVAPGAAAARPGLNENYARELMELHTLGVNGGYTQKDVVEVARAFTGWTIFDPNRVGEFDFNPAMHDRGEKVVLGQTIPRAGGEERRPARPRDPGAASFDGTVHLRASCPSGSWPTTRRRSWWTAWPRPSRRRMATSAP